MYTDEDGIESEHLVVGTSRTPCYCRAMGDPVPISECNEVGHLIGESTSCLMCPREGVMYYDTPEGVDTLPDEVADLVDIRNRLQAGLFDALTDATLRASILQRIDEIDVKIASLKPMVEG